MKFQMPRDLGDQIRKEFEKEIRARLRGGGVDVTNVKVKIDTAGHLDLSGFSCKKDQKKAEDLLEKMQRTSR